MVTPIFETQGLVFNHHITYPDMTIMRDAPTFFVGESGSGKTSLFRMFNRTLTPESGSIAFSGSDIFSFDPIDLRKQVLLVSQSVFLFDDSIHKNFRSFYEMTERPLISDSEINDYLKLCNIPIPLDSDCCVLSGGERQRVYLAIFLSFKPQVLLLDEPTSALDADNTKIVMENIIEFCKTHTVTPLIISHDEKTIDKYANAVLRLS